MLCQCYSLTVLLMFGMTINPPKIHLKHRTMNTIRLNVIDKLSSSAEGDSGGYT
jgi:hypothetical protein